MPEKTKFICELCLKKPEFGNMNQRPYVNR